MLNHEPINLADHTNKMVMNARRRAFAIDQAKAIRAALRAFESGLWREAGEKAKQMGLYRPSTYTGDAATGLQSHAGLRHYSMVRREEEQ